MKLLVALLAGLSVGCLVQEITDLSEKVRRPSRDFVTRYLRRSAEKLVAQPWPWLARYLHHLHPMLKEVSLPSGMDMPLFVALHAVAGLPLWLLAAFAFPRTALWTLPLCLAVGAVLPYGWLKHQQTQHHTALLKALPDCLELQALVMEAGLDLNAGIQHYVDKGTPSPLQPLLREAQKEIQMGRSRVEAFSVLAQKTTFAPLRDACRGIVQALSLGTSLAPLLREQAAALRIKRMHLAEKKAAEAPLKVLFPLFAFIFPTIFIVLLGPMVLLFARGGF